ncbi:MAG: NAD+ synthase [Chlorobi bacterium]|nr:NAD+ synthase [Chlorobiota bacterium]
MKIALAQLNYHVGNFESNYHKIDKAVSEAKNNNADLIVFSELSVCGYPPLDLLEQKDFITTVENTLDRIKTLSKGIAIIVGAPLVNSNPLGKKLYNAAFFFNNEKLVSVHKKTLLPTYDIFNEYRYFEPNTDFELACLNNKKFAITICEDLWDDQPVENSFDKAKLYTISPMQEIIEQKPDFIVNIAASPYSYNREGAREKVLCQNAKKYSLPVVYVNQTGAQTELIFDGGSMVINSAGKIVHQLDIFKEDIYYTSIEDVNNSQSIDYHNKYNNHIAKIHDALILGIKDYFTKMNFSKATLGLSGGIDSAVTLVLAERALGNKNIRVLLLPSKYSSAHSITDAKKLAENLNIKYDIVPVKNAVEVLNNELKPLFNNLKEDITEENIQARIRGVFLMAVSNKFGHILLNTSNKSEAAVGYGTLYGDMNGGLSVIGDVYKTDVFKLARFINSEVEIIPENTIIKPPSAELKPGQTDQDSLPPYEILDKVLFHFIEQKLSVKEIIEKGYEASLIEKILKMVNNSEYKRFQSPPILRISSKAFGIGRRIPLVARYH